MGRHERPEGVGITMIDGKPHRSYAKRCACGFADAVIINNVKNSKPKDQVEQEARLIVRKFEAKGWEIGKHDICPTCIQKRDFAPKKEEPKTVVVEVENMQPETQSHPDALFKPSFAERQLILLKLIDVYVSETVGYQPGWTDERVAKDLGVSRVWVQQLRDENFGPSGSNPEIDEAINQGEALLKDLSVQIGEIKDWKEKLEDWRKRTLEKIDSQLSAVNATLAKYEGNIRELRSKLDAITKAVKPTTNVAAPPIKG